MKSINFDTAKYWKSSIGFIVRNLVIILIVFLGLHYKGVFEGGNYLVLFGIFLLSFFLSSFIYLYYRYYSRNLSEIIQTEKGFSVSFFSFWRNLSHDEYSMNFEVEFKLKVKHNPRSQTSFFHLVKFRDSNKTIRFYLSESDVIRLLEYCCSGLSIEWEATKSHHCIKVQNNVPTYSFEY